MAVEELKKRGRLSVSGTPFPIVWEAEDKSEVSFYTAK
jgi:hypothetical protein